MNEGRELARSAGLVGLFTLASRILGLVRDAVVAASYPKSATDVFFVAYTIPNVLRQLLAEGALTVAFIPVMTEYRQTRTAEETRRMLSSLFGSALLVLSLVALLGALAAPWVVRLFAYGFSAEPEKLGLAVLLTRVMFVFLIAVGLTAVAMGALNTDRHFASPALAPVTLNAVIIVVILTCSGLMVRLGQPTILALACGVVLGGVAQVLLQVPALARRHLLVRPRLGITDPGVVRMARLMVPSIAGLAIYQLNIILSRQFASFLPEGSISALYYSQRLIEFPMGIFAVAIATVSMPSLSSHASAGNLEALKSTYRYALAMVSFIIIPATAGLFAVALPLCSVLYQRGSFPHSLAAQTASTLRGFLAGLWAAAGVRQTVPVFYSLQETAMPVKVACLTVLVYAGTAAALYRPLGTVGLALAVAVSSSTNFLALLLLLRRRLGRLGLRGVGASVLRSGLAAMLAAASAWLVARPGHWEEGGRAPGNYALLLCAVAVAVLVYVALAWMLRVPELGELVRAFRQRRRGAKEET